MSASSTRFTPEGAVAVPAKRRKAARRTLRAAGAVSSMVGGSSGAEAVHSHVAGVGSGWPAPSTARTASVCGPTATCGGSYGEAHAPNGPPSRPHWNVPASEAENTKVGVGSVVLRGGPETIVVSGGGSSAAAPADAPSAASSAQMTAAAVLTTWAPVLRASPQ
jgi:hypothetical protein